MRRPRLTGTIFVEEGTTLTLAAYEHQLTVFDAWLGAPKHGFGQLAAEVGCYNAITVLREASRQPHMFKLRPHQAPARGRHCAALLVLTSAMRVTAAHAELPSTAVVDKDETHEEEPPPPPSPYTTQTTLLQRGDALPPLPPTELDFLQYGAAFAVEGRARAGSVCPAQSTAPCILGSGGGIVLRAGHRSHEGWYLGGAYEFSKQNSSNLLRLPILQQLRGEVRRYLLRGLRVSPYLALGAGAAAYGSEWNIDTFGPVVSPQVGIEYESSREVFIGFAPAYRVMRLQSWTDGAGQHRPAAFAHFVGFELTLEARTPFARW